MKTLYLSETEDLQVLNIKDILSNFIKKGVHPFDLKSMIKSFDAQGFYIGSHVVVGRYAVIKLDLPKYTISVLSK